MKPKVPGKKVVFLLFLLILIVSFSGCTKKVEVNRKISPMATSGMITYGLYNMDGEIENGHHFEIKSDETFEKIFSFGNLIEVERDYRLLIFSNYIQVDFSVDGRMPTSYFDFTAKPNEHIDFTFSIPGLQDGFYDLLFVIVKDPNNLSLDEEYRKQTDLSHLTIMRYSLQKGEDKPNTEVPVINVLDTSEDTMLNGIFLNQHSDKLQRLLTLECDSNEDNNLYVHIGNQTEEEHEYIVILLCDWNQISIDLQNMIYCSVPARSRSVLPVRVSITEEGIHNITAICVQDPFLLVTDKTPRPDFSIRVGINVK